MARISTYPIDSVLQAGDKFIGTDVDGSTINVTTEKFVEFINSSGTLQGNSSARFTYISMPGSNRPSGSIIFNGFVGDIVPFDQVDEILISRYNIDGKDFRSYYPAIVSGRIIIQKASDVSTFAIYDVINQDFFEPDTDFHQVSLSYVTGNGSLENDEDYFVFLLQYSDDIKDKHFVFEQATVSESWDVIHNLEKYPAVDVVDSGGNVIIAEIKYIDKNRLQVNFGHATSGKAYMN
jgi:hypothetical protein